MKKWKISALAGIAVSGLLLAGCGKSSSSDDESVSPNKTLTVTVYDDLANYQGIQSGWFGKLVKDKFNIKLKIIAPNVAGGGNTLFDTRSAAGNLGDIVITGAESGRAKNLVKSGLIVDMSKYAKGCKYIKKYKGATDSFNGNVGKKSGDWGIPGSVSSSSPTAASEGIEPTYGPYLRWDYYSKIGYPKINTLEDLLPVLKKMQDVARKENPGKKIYALSLFKDWDSNMMNNAKQPATFYGYDEIGFVLAKADGKEYQDITKSNSQYVRALRFFNKANQMGLVDPESSTQNYDKLYSKYQDGKVLFSFWPWLGESAFNTTANKNAGKGFEMVDVQDMKIFSKGYTPNGSSTFIALGSKAKDKKRIVKFINWLYSPEGVLAGGAQTGGTAGVKGLTWKMQDGKPVLTEFGKKALLDGDAKVPTKWGGGQYKNGVSALNFPAVAPTDKDPNTGYSYSYNAWPSVLAMNNSSLDKDWQAHMGNAQTAMEYLKKNHKLLVAPGSSYIIPDEKSELSTLRGQAKTEIVNSSWKMVFVKNDSTFNSDLKKMQSTLKGLDYKKILNVDLKNAKDQNKARLDVVKQYKNRE